MTPEAINSFFSIMIGFAVAGALTSGYQALADRPAGFGLLTRGAKKARLQAKAFGGGTIIDTDSGSLSIGMRNASFTKEWLKRESIPLLSSDFLGPWSRKIIFLPTSGDAFCKRMVTNMATAEVIAREERAYAETLQQKSQAPEKKIELF